MRRLIIGPLVLLVVAALFLWWPTRGRDHDTAPVPSPPQITLLPLDPGTATAPPEPAVDQAQPDPDQASATAPAPQDWAEEEELVLTGTDVQVETTDEPETTGEVDEPQQPTEELARYEAAAAEFMKAFARPEPGTDPSQWWSQVGPLMAPRAAEVYASTDPQQVPFSEVTGPPQVVPTPAPAHLLRQVRVPTDAGTYLVGLETDETGIHVVDLVREQQ